MISPKANSPTIVAATFVGLFAFGLIMTILGFICIIGMVASSNSKPALKEHAVMVMKLQGQIDDRTEDSWLGELTGEQFNNKMCIRDSTETQRLHTLDHWLQVVFHLLRRCDTSNQQSMVVFQLLLGRCV